MSFSATEVMALAQKAARGAGFPPAQAEAFGRAAVIHLGADRPGDALRAALADPKDSPILRLPLLMDDVFRAAASLPEPIELSLQTGDEALAPAYIRTLPIRIVSCKVQPGTDGPARLVIEADPSTPAKPSLPPRIALPDDLAAELSALAQKTYVPATEESRRKGAGAGLTDND